MSRANEIWDKMAQRISTSNYTLSELQNGEQLLDSAISRLSRYGKYQLCSILEDSSLFNKKTRSLIKDGFTFYADSYLVTERGNNSEGKTTAILHVDLSSDKLTISVDGINEEYIKSHLSQRVTNLVVEKLKHCVEIGVERKVSLGDGDNVPNSIDIYSVNNDVITISFFFIVGKEGWPRLIRFYGHSKSDFVDIDKFTTTKDIEYIRNFAFKLNAISQNYIKYGADVDPQDYFMEQVEANPNLLSWLFDDPSLYGKSYLALDCGQLEAFQTFYNSLSIYDD